MGQFFDELKRRNVVRVGIAYVVIGWLVFQVGEVLFPVFGAPDWVFKTLILVFALGFPLVLIFAWAFELTSDGIKKTRDVSLAGSVTASTGRKIDYLIIAALVLALGYFIWERQGLIDASTNDQAASNGGSISVTEENAGAAAVVAKRRSIAVLPFVNMSSDKEQSWFADGLTEEILNSLARTPDLLVAARTSSFGYRDSLEDVPTIARALGVEHILEGSVRRSGDRLRVTAQLIRASDGFHLWSQTYDRYLDDMIEIQESVAIAIANALETAMDPAALARMVSSGTLSVPAFAAYLRGLAFEQQSASSGDAYLRLDAREAFEQALSLDPAFALAYWKLAEFWSLQMAETLTISGLTDLTPAEMMPFYEDAISKAIRHEPDPVKQLFYRADKAWNDLKIQQALRLVDEYLAKRPNDQRAQLRQIILLSIFGVRQQMSDAIARYYASDGFDTGVTNVSLTALLLADDHDEIRTFASNAVKRFGDHVGVLYQAHRDLLWAGDLDGASKLAPILQASDLSESARYLASLRQACAENRNAEATQLYDRANEQFADNTSIIWLGQRIMGDEQQAVATLMVLDDQQNMLAMTDYLPYAFFDPRPFPNLMALLQVQGVERGEPVAIPYRCKR